MVCSSPHLCDGRLISLCNANRDHHHHHHSTTLAWAALLLSACTRRLSCRREWNMPHVFRAIMHIHVCVCGREQSWVSNTHICSLHGRFLKRRPSSEALVPLCELLSPGTTTAPLAARAAAAAAVATSKSSNSRLPEPSPSTSCSLLLVPEPPPVPLLAVLVTALASTLPVRAAAPGLVLLLAVAVA